MTKSITLQSAISQHLESLIEPVLTKYYLSSLIFNLYKKKIFKRVPLRLKKELPNPSDINYTLRNLLEAGIITSKSNTAKDIYYNISGRKKYSAGEFCCSIDPFSYISHASAMEHYGLTDRLFKAVTVTTLNNLLWKIKSVEKMKEDLSLDYGTYLNLKLQKMTFIHAKSINRTPIIQLRRKNLGKWRQLEDRFERVATVGRTFLDMLRDPDQCGGIDHVIDVFKEHASRYLNVIKNEFEKDGSDADKIRCGYILEKLVGVKGDFIGEWKGLKQRGGSRKLDPTQPYSHIYSEDWDLSINIEGISSE